ncbi:MAG TPA: hypothetical protein VFA04_05640 [Bryobacteraceae bacterium]|nr:hypothetical protein [Bryobacteraceae bacterium]
MPVTVVNKPKDEALRQGPRNEVQKRIEGALLQLYAARTYAGVDAVSSYGSGSTTYKVEMPRCDNDCQCLIVASVTGEIKGHVDSLASDWGFGKSLASADAKLSSSLGSSPAQLAISSGDGAESYEISGEAAGAPKANVKVTGRLPSGPLDRVSQYSSGPVSFNTCYADIVVTAEGSVNGNINSWCDSSSYAEAAIGITHECSIAAYCVCKGERKLIFEWSISSESGSTYSKRSTLDEEYEKKLKSDADKLRTDVARTAPPVSRSEQSKLMRILAARPKAPRRSANDILTKMRNSLRAQGSKPNAG